MWRGLWFLFIAGCAAEAGSPKLPAANVIVITLDTTRTDALSCYGRVPALVHEGPTTPNLDAFAAAGIRFDSAWAHTPTTLSSHISMFTGLDPHGHGVPRNGFVLGSDVPTLAARLASHGYDTIAVVGAKALERGMGLERGFRVYDDAAPNKRALMYQDVADSVRARAEAAIDGRQPNQPLFLWVHFYDAHAPYEPPAPYDTEFEDPANPRVFKTSGKRLGKLQDALMDGTARPADLAHVAAQYQGEVAFIDAQVALLLDKLAREHLLDRAIVAIAADHGEGLSDEPEFAYAHGTSISPQAVRVPLLMRGYGDVPVAAREVVTRQVPLSTLGPTLLDVVGLDPRLGDHPSIYDLIRPGPTWDEQGWPDRPVRPVLIEASRPRDIESKQYWNNLPMRREVRVGDLSLYRFPNKQIETISDPRAADLLGSMLSDWDGRSPAHRTEQMSTETTDALRSLGYMEGSTPPVDDPGE
jgi:arylsulfatase A-like enzyme